MHNFEIKVSDKTYKILNSESGKSGLSINSFINNLIEINLPKKRKTEFELALEDLKNGNVEKVTYSDFKKELKELKGAWSI